MPGQRKIEDTLMDTFTLGEDYVKTLRMKYPWVERAISSGLRTKKNKMWIFKSNSQITIENSIYVENDMAVETSQIVISGITSSLKNKILWSLEKI